jgi:hypothetical protein
MRTVAISLPLAYLGLFLALPARAGCPVELNQALQERKVELTVAGKGETLDLTIKNLHAVPLTVVLNRGTTCLPMLTGVGVCVDSAKKRVIELAPGGQSALNLPQIGTFKIEGDPLTLREKPEKE